MAWASGRPVLGRLRTLAVAGLLALAVGCTAAPAPPSTSPATSVRPSAPATSATPAPATPSATSTPTPTSVAPLGKVPVGKKATLRVQPVDYDGSRVVVASFGKAGARRPVSLQRELASGWEEISSGKADRGGSVEFLVPLAKESYRAVAGGEGAAVATPTASAADQWRQKLADDFDGERLDRKVWGPRNEANYQAGGRSCSAAYFSNVAMVDGSVRLRMTKETKAANQRKARAAGCNKGEYYRNAMISTEGRYTMRSGVAAARVKMPIGQGMHGSVWLQSYRQSEIDFVEAFGYGKGITAVAHIGGKQYPTKSADAWVLEDEVVDPAWWDEYHVFSVEWVDGELVYRVDGKETQRITKSPVKTDYFLVISLLSSDWELSRLRKPVQGAPGVEPVPLPASMHVDWVRVWEPRD